MSYENIIVEIGDDFVAEITLIGDLISAREAFTMGLINRVMPESDLDKETRNWAAILAQKSPQALQIAKKAFYVAADMDYYKSFEYMNEAFARLCTTEDAKEGISAFLEKRSPEWKLK